MIREISITKAYRLINSSPVVLITSSFKDKKNVMTLNWLTVINSEPFVIGAGIAQDSYTASLIDKSNEFGINIPEKNLLEKIKICGSLSGRDVDKFEKANLTIFEFPKIKVPLIKECIGFIECRVEKKLKYGDVNFYIAKGINALADSRFFENDLWNIKKIKLIHHLGGGNFYFSALE